MTTFAHRIITSTRVEYGVKAGCNIGDINKVRRIAWVDWCRRTNHDPEGGEYEDWSQVYPRDEETVIAFVVEHDASQADREIERLTSLVGKRDDQIRKLLDLVDRVDREGWAQVLADFDGDDIPQAIRRLLT